MSKRVSVFVEVLLLLSCVIWMSGVAGQNTDSDIFRVLYDKVADLTTTGVSPDGRVTEVFLAELPGYAVRREDFDPDVWQANRFVDAMPSAAFARMVDRVPKYSSLAFMDSGASISQVWQHILRQFVVPLDLDPATEDLIADARRALNGTELEEEVSERFQVWQDSLESALSLRESCLATREPSICAQQAVVWREDLRRAWFGLEVVRSELESAQSRLIALQVRDLTSAFTKALERAEQSKRVDVGANSFGQEFYHTTATPSNWWKWFPLDPSAYDYFVDSRTNNAVDIPLPSCGTTTPADVFDQPVFGTIAFDSSNCNITYTANDAGFIGADSFAVLLGGTDPRRYSIGVNGDVLLQGGASWVSVSLTEADTSTATASQYSILHRNNQFVRNAGAISYKGSFSTSLNTAEGYSFTSGGYGISFELAKVSITRRWFDTTLWNLYPVGVRGVRQFGFSDGNPLFTTDANFIFNMLPTSFLVARNIRLSSTVISDQQSTISQALTTDSVGTVNIGPFVVGRSSLKYRNGATHSNTRFESDGTLVIDGPQIVGWVCTPLPPFPSADFADIEALNRANGKILKQARLATAAIDNGLGVSVEDWINAQTAASSFSDSEADSSTSSTSTSN